MKMRKTIRYILTAILIGSGMSTQAQMKRSDDFRAKYQLKEDAPTTVRSTSLSDSQPAAIYNLQGQRLDNPQRGVNIVGGNKKIANQ